jgi:hypothetical protein
VQHYKQQCFFSSYQKRDQQVGIHIKKAHPKYTAGNVKIQEYGIVRAGLLVFTFIRSAQQKGKREKYDPTYGMKQYNYPLFACEIKFHFIKVPKNSAKEHRIPKHCDKSKVYIDESLKNKA